MKYCFGVDIGGTTVKMGLFEENGTIVDKWEITTDTSEEGKAILPNVAASVEKKIEEHQISKEDIKNFIEGLDVAESVKEELRRLSPHTYTGVCRY